MELTGTGVWSHELRYGDPGEVRDAAAELESLGYTAAWIPDVGGDLFTPLAHLLASIPHKATIKTKDGTETNIASMEVFRVVDGKITEVWNCGYQQGVWN